MFVGPQCAARCLLLLLLLVRLLHHSLTPEAQDIVWITKCLNPPNIFTGTESAHVGVNVEGLNWFIFCPLEASSSLWLITASVFLSNLCKCDTVWPNAGSAVWKRPEDVLKKLRAVDVTKYIYSSTVSKRHFEVVCLLYTSTSLHFGGRYSTFLLDYIYLIADCMPH